MKTHDELLNMSMSQQLGYLQWLAGWVYLDTAIDESIRNIALDVEECLVHWYKKIALGHCSLLEMNENPLDKMEEEIIEKIEYYQSLLQFVVDGETITVVVPRKKE